MGKGLEGWLPLTKRAHALSFASRGLAILSHKGRGRCHKRRQRLWLGERHESTSPLVGEDTQASQA
jgi:hypothetical protein